MKNSCLLLVITGILIGCHQESDRDDLVFNPQKKEEILIFENGNFLSFTDLIEYDQKIYCVFREGDAHVSDNGIIHIIKRHDSGEWKTEDLVRVPGYDLRDPKFLIDADSKLCVYFSGIIRGEDGIIELKNYIARFYLNVNDKLTLDTVDEVYIEGLSDKVWLWNVAWHNDKAYGVCYHVAYHHGPCLVSSENGTDYEVVTELSCSLVPPDQYMSEVAMEFSADHCLRIVSRVDAKVGSAVYGVSYPPYEDWKWYTLDQFLAGPVIKTIHNKTYVAGKSVKNGRLHTVLYELEPENGKLKYIWHSSSWGDTGYPGLAYGDKEILMSFYAQDGDNKSHIYLMRYW